MSKFIVGIDPGKSGGWSLFNFETKLVTADKLPIAGKELDIRRLIAKLGELTNYKFDTIIAIIEEVHAMPKQGVSSMFTFGKGFGKLIGMFEAVGAKIQYVRPSTWKKKVLFDTKKDKYAAIDFVTSNFDVKLIPDGCRKPSDGIADAVCIMHYGVMNNA